MSPLLLGRRCERPHLHDSFLPEVESNLAGGEDPDRGTGGEKLRRKVADDVDQVLAVVENQQERTGPHVRHQVLAEITPLDLLHTEDRRNRRNEAVAALDASQVDPPRDGRNAGRIVERLARESRLPHPSRTHQGHGPMARDRLGDLRKLLLPGKEAVLERGLAEARSLLELAPRRRSLGDGHRLAHGDQRSLELRHRADPDPGFTCEGALDDHLQLGRESGSPSMDGEDLIPLGPLDQLLEARGRDRVVSGGQPIQQRPHGVHVGHDRRWPAKKSFRRHRDRRPDECPVEAGLAGRTGHHGRAEVDEDRPAGDVLHHVRGLDVSVHEPDLVNGIERADQVDSDSEHVRGRHWSRGDRLLQGAPADNLGPHSDFARDDVHSVDHQNVRMPDPGKGARFPQAGLDVDVRRRGPALEGDLALKGGIVGELDLSVSPGTERTEQIEHPPALPRSSSPGSLPSWSLASFSRRSSISSAPESAVALDRALAQSTDFPSTI